MYPSFVLAQILGSDEILEQGKTTAQAIAQAWNQQWQDVLTGDLYSILTQLGVFFAVSTLLFYMMQWAKNLTYGEFYRPISSFIWPLLIATILANNGTILSGFTLAARNYLDGINQEIMKISDLRLGENYQQAIQKKPIEELAGSLLRNCEALTGEPQLECLAEAKDKIAQILADYKASYNSPDWVNNLETQVNQMVAAAKQGKPVELSFNASLSSTSQTNLQSFLLSTQYAFQTLIEIAMLLTAALGPVAVGLSLLPVAGKPIYVWLTGFFSLGIAKLSYNIIAGLTARVLITAGDSDSTWFLIFLAFLAPLLAIALAIGGGKAVFQAINNTATWVTRQT